MAQRGRATTAAGRSRLGAVGTAALLWLPVWLLELRVLYTPGHIASSPVLRATSGTSLLVMVALAACIGAVAAFAGSRVARRREARGLEPLVVALASVFVLALRQPLQRVLGSDALGLEASPIGGGLALLVGIACSAAAGLGVLAARLPLPEDARRFLLPGLAVLACGVWSGWVDASLPRVDPLVRRPLLVSHFVGMALAVASGLPALAARRRAFAVAAGVSAVLFPAVWVALAGRPAASSLRVTTGGERPDVVVVMIDTLRADHAFRRVDGRPTMPALERLAEGRATTFRRAYAGSPATRPSVKALFTSLRPTSWGVEQTSAPPPPDVWNLATAFRESGYRTAAFSANGVLDRPGFRAGFDRFWVASGLHQLQRSLLLNRLLCLNVDLCAIRLSGRLRLHKEDGRVIRDLARGWLRDTDRPFFLYLHLIDPHWPYYDRGFGFRDARLRQTRDPFRHWRLLRLPKDDPANAALRDAPQHEEMLSRYHEEVRHADRVLEGILSDLAAKGALDSSLVVVVGDHGEEFFEHLGFGHGHDVYDEQLRVPLVIKWPQGPAFEALPRVLEAPMSLLDVLPTLTDFLALKPPPTPLQGRSLRPLLEGVRDTGERAVVSEIRYRGRVRVAYREGRYKVRLEYPDTGSPRTAAIEVFDLEADPEERAPLSPSREGYAALVERARGDALASWLEARRGRRAPAPSPRPAADVLEQLRELGYVGDD